MSNINTTEEDDIMKLSLQDLQLATDEHFKKNGETPREIWRPYLMLMFKGIPNVTLDLDGNDYIYTTEEDLAFLHKMALVISQTPDVLIELYAWWITVQSMIMSTTSEMISYIVNETSQSKSYSVVRLR